MSGGRAESDIVNQFSQLYSDLKDDDQFQHKRPLLAHYTSIQTLEGILKADEVWFSNPLYMNDLEEVRFGVLQGVPLILNSAEIQQACGGPERASIFRNAFDHYQSEFSNRHVLDTYVFCLSEHDLSDQDGALSMWRGYGSNGNGACIVFDTGKMNVNESSPLLLARVEYGSAEDRMAWLQTLVAQFARLLNANPIVDTQLYLAAYALFQRLKLFALFSKHRGFSEEREWRVVYMPDRDTSGLLRAMFDYWIGPNGVEPKLRFKVGPIAGVTDDDLSLTKIIDRIIIGPSVSSALSVAAIHRMMERLGKADLKDRVRGSRIPFRSRAFGA